ncbi:helix-turn-helix transcriptional regulator [Paenibacillus soyae]|uniref:AraC family transcriptional regulator n=1 Tax=Paenibacillus soyae TaxID=2969249 RepID=A0A9X2S961_9BACL|nr:AraC family transcriptional regulator [Paenibacillus soyae]MCR2802402.1 AraC family transcriptional regulator [Paenibacillus soyae]
MNANHQFKAPFTIGTASSYRDYFPYHTHSHYEIYYFRGGKANYLINDRIYVLEPGDLLLMHGMTLHKAHADPEVAYHRTIVHFDPHYFQQQIQPAYCDDLLAPFRMLHNVRLQLRGEEQQEIESSLSKMEALYNKQSPIALQRFHALFLDLMLQIRELCEQPLQAMPAFPSSKERHVQSVISDLEAHYSEDITLEHLQSRLHLSKYYLAKTFKEITGMTIFQFLMHRRIYEAKLQLIQTTKSITDIGYESGFKHPSHFSRAFKEHTELTPEQYRKRHQLGQPGRHSAKEA